MRTFTQSEIAYKLNRYIDERGAKVTAQPTQIQVTTKTGSLSFDRYKASPTPGRTVVNR